MAKFDPARLFGGRFKIEYPTTDPDVSIAFWIEHPSDGLKNFLLADSGMMDAPKNEEGDLLLQNGQGIKNYESYRVELAKHCIAGAENLEGWPEVCCIEAPSGWPTLSKEALDVIPLRQRRALLVDIGDKILSASEVSAEEGNESTQPVTGATSENSQKSQAEV